MLLPSNTDKPSLLAKPTGGGGSSYHSALRQLQKEGNAGPVRFTDVPTQPERREIFSCRGSCPNSVCLLFVLQELIPRHPSTHSISLWPLTHRPGQTAPLRSSLVFHSGFLSSGPGSLMALFSLSGSGQLSGAFEGAKYRLQGSWVRALPSGEFGLNHP